ncbi:MAG: hypothetical protein H8E55_51715 [Pelagibacterales bacterium]|nr:hypothetical protein [Pelagibacterales bacterium]
MIPSLLQIPSAVSDSKLYSVLPNNGKGDFQFDRSTGATRINRDGLIEEVGYFSSELVQNGNFSELGSELIVNGDFATDSDWTKGTGTTISDGNANFVNATGVSLYQNIGTQTGTVKVEFTVTNYTSGTLNAYSGGNQSVGVVNVSANALGTYTAYVVRTGGNNNIIFGSSDSFTGSIDNVSVKQVDPNDRWTLGTDVEYGNSFIKMNNSAALAGAQQTNVITSGVQCKVTFTVQNYVSGTVNLRHPLNQDVTANGTYVFEGAANDTKVLIRGNAVTNNFEVTNISVVEVQGDRPRLSYDITNGVVEDKPHLLLEPSRTNKYLYSQDFSDAYWTKSGTSVVSGFASPDGTLNAFKLIGDGANSTHFLRRYIATTALTNHSFSFFVKKGEITKFGIREDAQTGNYVSFDLETKTIITSVVMTLTYEEVGDYLKIKIVSQIGSNGTAGYAIYMLDDAYSGGVVNGSRVIPNGSGFYIFGAQLEAGSYATSYIPTSGSAVTRAAETCNNSKPSVNSTEGVLYAEISALADDGTNRILGISNGGVFNNSVLLRFSSASNRIQAQVRLGGVYQCSLNYDVTDATEFNKIAFKYKQNDFSLFVNGIERATDTSGNVVTGLDVLDFDISTTNEFYGKVKGLAVYNEALTDAQLQTLTT